MENGYSLSGEYPFFCSGLFMQQPDVIKNISDYPADTPHIFLNQKAFYLAVLSPASGGG